MKKFLFIVFAVSILSACNHSKVESNNVNDSTQVYSMQVDSTQVDSMQVDSVK